MQVSELLTSVSLCNDYRAGVIYPGVKYAANVELNCHTKDWELTIFDDKALIDTYLYNTRAEALDDVDALVYLGIDIEIE